MILRNLWSAMNYNVDIDQPTDARQNTMTIWRLFPEKIDMGCKAITKGVNYIRSNKIYWHENTFHM